jgi:hypothetical protein
VIAMLIPSSKLGPIIEAARTLPQEEIVGMILEANVPVLDHSTIPTSMCIDDYLPDADEVYDTVSSWYLQLIEALQDTAEADAQPFAYRDLAAKLLLRTVDDIINSTQDDLQNT